MGNSLKKNLKPKIHFGFHAQTRHTTNTPINRVSEQEVQKYVQRMANLQGEQHCHSIAMFRDLHGRQPSFCSGDDTSLVLPLSQEGCYPARLVLPLSQEGCYPARSTKRNSNDGSLISKIYANFYTGMLSHQRADGRVLLKKKILSRCTIGGWRWNSPIISE